MPTLSLTVELFEYVPAAADTVLLRLEGRWHAPTREPLPMPTLVVDDGRRSRRLSALPGPDAAPPQAGPEPELWRASFPAPAALLDDPRVAFALDAGRGHILDLPAAAPRGAGRRYSRSSHAELARERTRAADAERLADDRRRALRDAESALDRERSARAAERMRADAAEAEAARLQAELEAASDHLRADTAQHARDMEAASGALAIAQARVRELDEALLAQRRRTLAAESAATSAAEEAQSALAHERARGAEALAAQRTLAEEATRARVAAEARVREHVARVADLEVMRDELRATLDREREARREAQARDVGEQAVEERQRVRELQRRTEAAERRAADAERRLEAAAERLPSEDAPDQAALVAEVAAQRARADEAQRQVRQMAEELVEAAQLRTDLQEELAAARAEQAPPADPAPGPDVAALEAALEQERAARQRAEEEARLAIDERAELERRLAEPAPSLDPEPEPELASGGRAVFGPFGDAGDVDVRSEDAPEPVAVAAEREAGGAADMRPRRWDTDEFDLFSPDDDAVSATERSLARRSGAGARRARDLEPAPSPRSTRTAIAIGAVIAVGVLLGLKVAGVLGVLVLPS